MGACSRSQQLSGPGYVEGIKERRRGRGGEFLAFQVGGAPTVCFGDAWGLALRTSPPGRIAVLSRCSNTKPRAPQPSAHALAISLDLPPRTQLAPPSLIVRRAPLPHLLTTSWRHGCSRALALAALALPSSSSCFSVRPDAPSSCMRHANTFAQVNRP